MTEDELLIATRSLDGLRWHSVEYSDTVDRTEEGDPVDKHVTLCGRSLSPSQQADVSPVGEPIADLSGTTICYGCVRVGGRK
jgi:hypothetical protein